MLKKLETSYLAIWILLNFVSYSDLIGCWRRDAQEENMPSSCPSLVDMSSLLIRVRYG